MAEAESDRRFAAVRRFDRSSTRQIGLLQEERHHGFGRGLVGRN